MQSRAPGLVERKVRPHFGQETPWLVSAVLSRSRSWGGLGHGRRLVGVTGMTIL